VISVDALPDDVLIAIFDQYVNGGDQHPIDKGEAWQSLVHVCRRWRSIVFGSPRHLKLQLVCTETTRARDMLDVWPALPLAIWCDRLRGSDNIIAALERRERVCQIDLLNVQSSDLREYLEALQQPFSELTNLFLHCMGETVPVVPDSFLGGSAPRLESFDLTRIPFPGLPKLLLSATHLTTLHLCYIPHSGYISPEAMATALSTLTSLEDFTLKFESPRSCPDQASRRLPPSTRSILLALTYFQFKGVSEYLEDLVAGIDAPRLSRLHIALFNDTVFDTPQLIQFINFTPMPRALEKANISLRDYNTSLDFSSRTPSDGNINVETLCQGLDWQVSSLEQVCTSCLPPLSKLEDLYIYEAPYSQQDWKVDIENGPWLQLLHPFTAVENLYLSKRVAPHIGPALQELAEGRTTDVLPALQNIFLEGLGSSGPVQEGIAKFVAARQVASRPIAVSSWANSNRVKEYY
jgi:hypothetical protein